MSRIFFLDANAIYSYYGRDKLGFNSKPVDEKALRRFLLGKELSLPTSVLIEVITHFREDVDKLYDLLQFIRELGLPIYNNMPDYCYEPLTLMVLSNMNKEELKNYSRHLLAKKVEIEAKFVLLFHEITRDLYAEYKLRGTKLSQDDRDRVLNFIGVNGYRDCAKQLEAELVGQLEQGYQNGNEQKILKDYYINKLNESCILIDEIIACAVAYKKSENDFIEVIQNTYNDSINAGLDGTNGTMKCIVDVLVQDKIFLDKAKTTIAAMFGKHAYSKKQTQYLSDVMFTAWFNNSQKLRKNDIFDMFVVGCLDAKPRSAPNCILEDNSPCLISFDKTMKNFIGVVYPYNYQLIESIK